MNNTIKATFFLGALLSAGTLLAQAPAATSNPSVDATQASPAQSGRPHREFDPAKAAEHMGKRLGLSSDQVAQITPLLSARRQQMEGLRADSTLAQQDRHAKAKAIIEDTNNKIEALLTDTQKQQFEQMQAERRQHHNHQRQS
jgi:Spy/CpxP family protein refolding chaperone